MTHHGHIQHHAYIYIYTAIRTALTLLAYTGTVAITPCLACVTCSSCPPDRSMSYTLHRQACLLEYRRHVQAYTRPPQSSKAHRLPTHNEVGMDLNQMPRSRRDPRLQGHACHCQRRPFAGGSVSVWVSSPVLSPMASPRSLGQRAPAA